MAGEPGQKKAGTNAAPEPVGGLVLKGGGPSPVKGGALRSPLMVPGSAPAPAAEKPADEKPAAPEKPAKPAPKPAARTQTRAGAPMREISAIHGLHETSHQLPGDTQATHLSHVMYDPAPARSRRFGLILALIAAVAFAAVMIFFPKQRKSILKTYTSVKEAVIGTVRKKPRKKRKLHPVAVPDDPAEADDPTPGPRAEANPRGPAPRRSCDFLTQAAAGNQKLAVAERVDLAECFVSVDDLASAEAALKPLSQQIQREKELSLNGQKSSRTIADAYLTLIAVYLREGKPREVGELLRGRCTRWEQSISCVGKAMLMADRKLSAPNDMQRLFESRGTLDGKAQARLWLAGSQIAATEGRGAVADKRYVMALTAAPKDALALRKHIYETQAMALYRRGELVGVKNATTRAKEDLKALGRKPLTKLQLLLDLATSPNKGKAVRTALTNEERTFRAAADLDLIEILGPESLRHGLEEEYLRLLKRTRDFYTSKYRSVENVSRKLALWEIRATMSKRDYEKSLTLIAGYEKTAKDEPLPKHLRGVTYALMATNEKYQVLAAQEFQGALRIRRNWESLAALGFALVRAGKPEQVASVIKDLDKQLTKEGQRYWSDMLKAEWYVATRKYPQAEKLLMNWITKEPDYFTPRQLLVKLNEAQQRSDLARQAQGALDEVAKQRRFQGSYEAFSSPLGVMALADRPID